MQKEWQESNRIELKRELTDALEYEEEFFMGYSVPQNKELMRVFRDLDMVEQLGSGVPRILEHYPRSIYRFSPILSGWCCLMRRASNKLPDKLPDRLPDKLPIKLTSCYSFAPFPVQRKK